MPTEEKVDGTLTPEVDESWVNLAQVRADRAKEQETPATPVEKTEEAVKTAPVTEAGTAEEEEIEGTDKDGKPAKVKVKGGFQRKIDKLTKEKSDLERTVGDLTSRLDALETKKPEVKVEAKAEGDPEPKEEDFKDYKEYAKSLARWVTRQELKADRENAQKSEKEQAEQQTKAKAKEQFDAFIGDMRKAREEDAEFEAVIQAGWSVPDWLDFEFKRRGAAGAKIAVALAKNKAVFEEIIKLNNETIERGDRDFTEAWDAFSAFARSLKTTSSPAKPEKPISQAPKPITPVGGGSGPTEVDADNMSVAEYRRARASGKVR